MLNETFFLITYRSDAMSILNWLLSNCLTNCISIFRFDFLSRSDFFSHRENESGGRENEQIRLQLIFTGSRGGFSSVAPGRLKGLPETFYPLDFFETTVTRVLNSKDTLPLRLLIGSMCSRCPCVKLKLNKLLDKSYRTLSTESSPFSFLIPILSTYEQTDTPLSSTLLLALSRRRANSIELQAIDRLTCEAAIDRQFQRHLAASNGNGNENSN